MEKWSLRDEIMVWCFVVFMAIFTIGEVLFSFGIVEMTNATVWIWRVIALPSAAGAVVTTITPIWNWVLRLCEKAAEWRK